MTTAMVPETTLAPVKPVGMLIEYRGARLPRYVDLPVPLEYKHQRTGTVVCNPIGLFPCEDGRKLLEFVGPDALFRFVGYQYPDGHTSKHETSFLDDTGRTTYPTMVAARKDIKKRKLAGHIERTIEGVYIVVKDSDEAPITIDPTASLEDTTPDADEEDDHDAPE